MLTREQALKAYWRGTHRDYRGTMNGVRTVMVYRNGTCLVALDSLTDAEISDRVKDYQP